MRGYIAQGVAGATATGYSDITTRDEITTNNLTTADPDYSLEQYPYAYIINEAGITGPNGNYIETRTNVSSNCLMLSSQCENPEAAMEVISWQYESWENYQKMCIRDSFSRTGWTWTRTMPRWTQPWCSVCTRMGGRSIAGQWTRRKKRGASSPWAWIISPAISWKAATDSTAFAPRCRIPPEWFDAIENPA